MEILGELNDKAGSKFINHKQQNYKQFKPMNLAPQGFTSIGMIEKMKELIQKFANSEEVQKEVPNLQNFKAWLGSFKLEAIPKEAVDELMMLIEAAEEKNKIALIDLTRLLMMHEHSAAYILNKHWESLSVSILGYMQCMDLKDTEAKVI